MAERKIIKANSTKKQEIAEEKARKTSPKVDLKAQERLAEILNDSPRLVTLNGTEWEVKALRMGTQWLIAQKCVQVAKAEGANFGDIIKQFAVNIPAVVEVLVLALLNDKNKIFEDGIESNGYSELYKSTYETLMWDCKVEDFGNIFLEVLQLIDVSFFMESHRILEIFRESTMARKRMIPEQK